MATFRECPVAIFKFGELAHLQSLQSGSIYMLPQQHFCACENEVEQDSFEGTSRWFNPAESEIVVDGSRLTIDDGTLSASLRFTESQTKVFCACGFYRDQLRPNGKILDDRVCRHGDYVLVIWKVSTFFARLSHALAESRNSGIVEMHDAGRVSYFDEDSFDGDVGPFRKRRKFEFESEWRLMIRTTANRDEEHRLEIGSIADASVLIKTSNFKNRIVQRPDGAFELATS